MSGPTILVVEDNPKNMKLVRDVLQFSGYDVIEATTGEDGVRVAGERAVDLVLMDLQLPGIDGTETLRRLRGGVLSDDVPVIALSALVMDQDHAAAETAGFDGYLNKPISVRALPDQVASFLPDEGP